MITIEFELHGRFDWYSILPILTNKPVYTWNIPQQVYQHAELCNSGLEELFDMPLGVDKFTMDISKRKMKNSYKIKIASKTSVHNFGSPNVAEFDGELQDIELNFYEWEYIYKKFGSTFYVRISV